MSEFHSTDRDKPVAPDTDGSADRDEDEETIDLADAMGDPDADTETHGGERTSPRYCAACGETTPSSGLTWLAIRDDSGASHTAICRDCAHEAARPPACAICRATGTETYSVTYVRNGERFGAVCAACRDGLCDGASVRR
ncbi:hypothetical protein [Halostella sp. PRR32]|uniref:hypothetical protein n=1 Tax=Halostella sp. PRR32 TaxID=3098147 RepID=UPI00110E8553|nr:hypothetical protein [Halostella sp. PRR32]